MRAHVIQGGKVANTIEISALDALPGVTLIDATLHGGTIGDDWDGEQIIPRVQTATVPHEVTMRQARLALLAAGKLSAVDTAINAMPEPQKSAARIEWDYSSAVQRSNAFVQQLGAALGMSSSQIDDLFITAAKL